MFDLNGIKTGTKLVNREGTLCIYKGHNIDGLTTETYPHAVEDRGNTYVFMNDGMFFSGYQLSKWDIVGFYKKEPRVRKPKPVNKLLGVLEYIQEQAHVETWHSTDYICIWGAFHRGGKRFIYEYEYNTLPYLVRIGLEYGKMSTVHTLNNFKGAVTKLLKG